MIRPANGDSWFGNRLGVRIRAASAQNQDYDPAARCLHNHFFDAIKPIATSLLTSFASPLGRLILQVPEALLRLSFRLDLATCRR